MLRRDTGFRAGPDRNGPVRTHLCRHWFLQLYSDYRDNRLDEDARAEVIAHMSECAACRRYDRVIRTGVAVLRNSLREDPAALMENRDRQEDGWPLERGGYSRPAIPGLTAAATLLVIALNLVSAWSPNLVQGVPEVEVSPVAAVEPFRPGAAVRFTLPPPHIPHFGHRPDEAGGDRMFVEYPRTISPGEAPGVAAAPVDRD